MMKYPISFIPLLCNFEMAILVFCQHDQLIFLAKSDLV
jgi:hypothetical protein